MSKIFITGSSGGIGKTLGLYLQSKDHNVIFNGRTAIEHVNIKPYICHDVTKSGILDILIESYGLPDILVCNAGYLGKDTLTNSTERQRELNINLLANIDIIEEAGKLGIKKIIVITTDNNYSFKNNNLLNYAYTKECLQNFTKVCARKFYSQGISVTNLCIDIPIETNMTKDISYGEDITQIIKFESPDIVIPLFMNILKEKFKVCTGQTYSLNKFKLCPFMEINHPGSNIDIKYLDKFYAEFDNFENSANVDQHLCMGHNVFGDKYPMQKTLLKTENKISEHLNLKEENITLVSGGITACFDLISKCFLNKGDEVIIVSQAFVFIYPILLQKQVNSVSCQNCFAHEILPLITSKTKMLLITNPVSLIGTGLSYGAIESVMEILPKHILVVIDECYIEYAENTEDSSLSQDIFNYADSLDNRYLSRRVYPSRIISMRTFSKFYGLGDARMGYIVSCKPYKELFAMMKLWKGYSHQVLFDIERVLNDKAYIEKTKLHYKTEKIYIYSQLKKIGLGYIPTQANFLVIEMKPEWNREEFSQKLKEEGNIIIPKESLIEQTFIYAISTREFNKSLLKFLKNFQS